MRRVLRHIQALRERNSCVELLATHGGVVEPLQVDDQDARKPVNCQILLHIHLFFTAIASEACVDHLLRLDKLVQAVSYLIDPKKRTAFLGISTLRSMKLSNASA